MTVTEEPISHEEAVLRCLFGPKRTDGAGEQIGSRDDLKRQSETLEECVARLLATYGRTEATPPLMSIYEFADLLEERYGTAANDERQSYGKTVNP